MSKKVKIVTERGHRVENKTTYGLFTPIHYIPLFTHLPSEPIVISDAEAEPTPSDHSVSGEETEHDLQPLNTAKRPQGTHLVSRCP